MIRRQCLQELNDSRVTLDTPIDDRDAAILRTKRGTLVVHVRERLGAAPTTVAVPAGVEDRGVRVTLQTESRDGGLTWSSLRKLHWRLSE